jgi:phosphoglycolate phosphatase-like HAD superfamily hydrolase
VSIAVFDIDGVVADVRHRLHHLQRHRWHRFFDAADSDPLLPEGATLVADLAREHEIVWLTGRPTWLRAVTTDWLSRHGLPGSEVHMRGDGDYRPARVYKLAVLKRLAPRGIAALVDDDAEVIDAAMRAGYPAVLADWVPRDADLRAAQEEWGRT